MFAYLNGVVSEVGQDRAVIDVFGLGFEVLCSAATLQTLKQGEPVKLVTHFHLTQDAVTLYGFYGEQEREMFRRLTSVTRIGPRIALTILSHLSVSDISLAIASNNPEAFDPVPGIGRKSAERLILELKEKIAEDELADGDEGGSAPRSEALAALVSLGYDMLKASRAINMVSLDARTTQDYISEALRFLSTGK